MTYPPRPFQLDQGIKSTQTKEQGSIILLPNQYLLFEASAIFFQKKRREKGRDLIFFVAVFQGMLWALLPRMGPQLPIGTITHHIVRGYAEQLAGGCV